MKMWYVLRRQYKNGALETAEIQGYPKIPCCPLPSKMEKIFPDGKLITEWFEDIGSAMARAEELGIKKFDYVCS